MVDGDRTPSYGNTAPGGASCHEPDRSGAPDSATRQERSVSSVIDGPEESESGATGRGSEDMKGKGRVEGDATMPAQLGASSSTSSSTNLVDRGAEGGDTRGAMVWQAEGESPIDRRVDGSEGGRCTHTHAASGAGVTSQHMDVDGALDPAGTYATARREAVRDPEFYIEGADCVIRVEDTLFRVSGAIQLSRLRTPSPSVLRAALGHTKLALHVESMPVDSLCVYVDPDADLELVNPDLLRHGIGRGGL